VGLWLIVSAVTKIHRKTVLKYHGHLAIHSYNALLIHVGGTESVIIIRGVLPYIHLGKVRTGTCVLMAACAGDSLHCGWVHLQRSGGQPRQPCAFPADSSLMFLPVSFDHSSPFKWATRSLRQMTDDFLQHGFLTPNLTDWSLSRATWPYRRDGESLCRGK